MGTAPSVTSKRDGKTGELIYTHAGLTESQRKAGKKESDLKTPKKSNSKKSSES